MEQETNTTKQEENDNNGVAIPLSEAQNWVKKWVDTNTIGNETFKPTDLRAFVVPRADFVDLLSQADTEYIRMYIGIKPNPDSKNGQEPCLVLVSAAIKGTTIPGYDGDDKDVIIDLIGEQTVYNIATGEEVTTDYEVFDFSRPCPPICDPKSPLFVPVEGVSC